MKISYAIPVHNEYKEIRRLLNILFKGKRDEDEIVVQCDKGNTTQDVYFTLQDFAHLPNFKIVEFSLNRDFASYKNNLKNSFEKLWSIFFFPYLICQYFFFNKFFVLKLKIKYSEGCNL